MSQSIAVLFGGRSGEHEVSLLSASSILRYIDLELFSVVPIGITHEGSWYLQDPDKTLAVAREGGTVSIDTNEQRRVYCVPGTARSGGGLRCGTTDLAVEVAFPVLHGSYGEDGTVQGLFEMSGIPYVGAPVLGSAIGMDKITVKCLWRDQNIPVVPFTMIDGRSFRNDRITCLEEVTNRIYEAWNFPVFVKPSAAGSSVGITRVASADALPAALENAFRYDTMALVEPAVDAREIEVSVIGNHEPKVFTPGEVVPSHAFYDYDAKYIDPDGAALVVPADLSEEQREEAVSLARSAYVTSRAEGFSRVDLFLERGTDRFYVNEINTIPGFTHISMFPRMCEASGLSYPRLITRVIELALERNDSRSQLRFVYSSDSDSG